jgi:hypothetical protein
MPCDLHAFLKASAAHRSNIFEPDGEGYVGLALASSSRASHDISATIELPLTCHTSPPCLTILPYLSCSSGWEIAPRKDSGWEIAPRKDCPRAVVSVGIIATTFEAVLDTEGVLGGAARRPDCLDGLLPPGLFSMRLSANLPPFQRLAA